MRGISKFVAIVLVMVAARYVPFGDAMRWLVKPSSQPAIVTGSLQDQEQTGDAARQQVRRPRDAAADVRAILAQASSEKASGNNAPQRRPGGSRGREDETDDDGEIYIGGTGLLDETAVTEKEHPLATKHPNDYLVICEAGCRPSTDRIVYKISKLSAVNAAKAQRKMEVTSAAEGVESNENNEIVCLAGCYDDEPVKQRRAERTQEPAPIRTAQAGTPQRDEAMVQDRPAPHSADVLKDVAKDVAHGAPAAPAMPPAATASSTADPVVAAEPAASAAIAAPAPPAAPEVSRASVAAAASPLLTPASAPQPIAVAVAASVREIAAVHAISAEAAARRESKRATAAAPVPQPGWETKVTSLVMLPKPEKAVRSVVA